MIRLFAALARPPTGEVVKATVYDVTAPAAGDPTVSVTPLSCCAAAMPTVAVPPPVSEVVDTLSGPPAEGLLTPLSVTCTVAPAAIALPLNRPQVSVVPVGPPQEPIEAPPPTVIDDPL